MGGIDQPIHILVIDDVAPLRRMTVQVLTGAGYEVSEAASGADGLRLAREQQPALVLLDVGLPDINGVQVCHEIKAAPETATTFVVLFSGSNIDTLSQASGLEADADGYITRPISNRELVARVEAMLRLKHAEDALRRANEQLQLELAARLRSEEAVRQSEARLRIVADNAYDWEFWLSPEDTFLYCSPSCQEITGHAADEFLTRPQLLEEIIHPDDLALWIAHKREVSRSKEPDEVEFRIILPGGAVRWLEHACRPVYDADGRYLGRRGSCRDITKRRDAEVQHGAVLLSLRDSEARLRMLVENQGEGIGIVDPTEHFVFANPAAETIFGVLHAQPFEDSPSAADAMVERTTTEFWRASLLDDGAARAALLPDATVEGVSTAEAVTR